MPKLVKVKFQNGINSEIAYRDILNEITGDFVFEESEQPDFVIFGPYGNDLPKKGNYIRIGYYCENITPDLDNCEWAFGIPFEKEINHPKYKRIQWHALDPRLLVKQIDAEAVFKQKTKFCNFLYSNHVPYREEFFKQLSQYKKVDAPGKSMNNMPSIDEQYSGEKWEVKRQFLTPYKFTIAFENYSYPGYQTEKLYDAMRVNSIPVYCGDPYINEIFNEKSFVNATQYLPVYRNKLKNLFEKHSQYDFKDYRPGIFNGLKYKIRRKLKTAGKMQKMRLQLNKFDFTPLIDRIIELDKNPDLYITMLREPRFINNKIPGHLSLASRWREIFNSKTY